MVNQKSGATVGNSVNTLISYDPCFISYSRRRFFLTPYSQDKRNTRCQWNKIRNWCGGMSRTNIDIWIIVIAVHVWRFSDTACKAIQRINTYYSVIFQIRWGGDKQTDYYGHYSDHFNWIPNKRTHYQSAVNPSRILGLGSIVNWTHLSQFITRY